MIIEHRVGSIHLCSQHSWQRCFFKPLTTPTGAFAWVALDLGSSGTRRITIASPWQFRSLYMWHDISTRISPRTYSHGSRLSTYHRRFQVRDLDSVWYYCCSGRWHLLPMMALAGFYRHPSPQSLNLPIGLSDWSELYLSEGTVSSNLSTISGEGVVRFSAWKSPLPKRRAIHPRVLWSFQWQIHDDLGCSSCGVVDQEPKV